MINNNMTKLMGCGYVKFKKKYFLPLFIILNEIVLVTPVYCILEESVTRIRRIRTRVLKFDGSESLIKTMGCDTKQTKYPELKQLIYYNALFITMN